MEGETAAKPIYLITKRHPDIESASSAKVAPLPAIERLRRDAKIAPGKPGVMTV